MSGNVVLVESLHNVCTYNKTNYNEILRDFKNELLVKLFILLFISGSNRRGWNTTSQRYSSVIQPSSFSKSTPWGGSKDQEKPSFAPFDSGASASRNRGFGWSQNPFASPSSDGQKDEKKLL